MHKVLFPRVRSFQNFHQTQVISLEDHLLRLRLTHALSAEWPAGSEIDAAYAPHARQVYTLAPLAHKSSTGASALQRKARWLPMDAGNCRFCQCYRCHCIGSIHCRHCADRNTGSIGSTAVEYIKWRLHFAT